MKKYTGYNDKNGKRISDGNKVKGWDKEYEVCWSNWSVCWIIDGITGTGKLENCYKEIELIN